MKYKFIMTTCIVLLVIFRVATPVLGAAIVVDNPTNIIAVDSACSLAEAIENANNDAQTHVDCAAGSGADTLIITLTTNFDATGGAFPTSTNLSGSQAYYPDITSEIVINEASSVYNFVFSAVGNVRIFNVMATGNLTIEGMGLLGSTVNPAPNHPASNPRILATNARGGAIYLDDGILSITNSSLNSNGATGSNGTIYEDTAQPGHGGAIYGTTNSTITTLTNVDFLGNFVTGGSGYSSEPGAEGAGGAIYTLGSIGVIDNVTLNGNTATGGSGDHNVDGQARGGGIYAQTITNLINSRILNNSVTGGSGENGGRAFGGGIYVPSVVDLIDNVTVSGNRAIGGSGSGFSGFNGQGFGGGIYAQNITNLTNSRFTTNSATGGNCSDTLVSGLSRGGALYVNTASYISNVQFESNTATGGSGRYGGAAQGGAIYAQASITTLRNSTFLTNTATGGNGTSGTPDAPWRGGNGEGGAIYANGGMLNNLTFYDNSANSGGGANPGNSSGGAVSITNVTINHNTFLSNSADTNGDDIASRGNITLTASIVTSSGGVTDCSGSINDGGNNLRQDGGENSCPATGTVTVGTHIASAPADNSCVTTAAGSCISTIEALDIPVIDGTSGTCLVVNNADGRGFGRTTLCDVGAYESASEIYADIAITKAVALTVDGADVGFYNPGDTVTYTIVITNNGPVDATEVLVSDTFPSGVTSTGWSAVFTDTASGNANGSGDINEIVNIPANGTVTYTVTGTINNVDGTISNTATANDGILNDSNSVNNTATADFTVTNLTDISITKSVALTGDGADIGIYNPGDDVTYTLVVTNNGPVDAPEVLVVDTFPTGITITGWTAIYSGSASGNASGSGDINETVNIPAGDSVTYRVTGIISSNATASISNAATAMTDLPVDSDSGNNTATADFDVVSDSSVLKAEVSILGINQVVTEHNVTIQATVQLDVPAEFIDTGDVTVTISDPGVGTATSGADYATFAATILTFSGPLTPGSTPQQTVSINILEDMEFEGAEAFALMITDVTGEVIIGQPNTHTIVINDDDVNDSGAFNLYVEFNLQELQYYIDREIVNNPDIVDIEFALVTDFNPNTDAIMFTVRTTDGAVGNVEVNVQDNGQGFVLFSIGDVSISDANFNAIINDEMLTLTVESIDALLYATSGLNLDAMTVNDNTIQAQISR